MNISYKRFINLVKRDWQENQPEYYISLQAENILEEKAKINARTMLADYKRLFSQKLYKTNKPQSDLAEKEVLINHVPKLYAKLIEEDLNREILEVIELWEIKYQKFPKKIDNRIKSFAHKYYEYGKLILKKTNIHKRWNEKEKLIGFVFYYLNGLMHIYETKNRDLEISAWYWSKHYRLNWWIWYDFYMNLDKSQKEKIIDGETIDDQYIEYFLQKLKDHNEAKSSNQKKVKAHRPTEYDYRKIFSEFKRLRKTHENYSTTALLTKVVKSQNLQGDHSTITRWVSNNKRHMPNYTKYKSLTPTKLLEVAPLEDLLLMVDRSEAVDVNRQNLSDKN
jgi:hypothetical protein